MQWRDEGVLVATRRHGEGSAIIEVFTREHGRHAGLVRGGGSRKMAPVLQAGSQLSVEWHARLEDHLGSFRVDPVRSRAAAAMSGRAPLAAMGTVCAMISMSLPEREPHPRLYADTVMLMDAVGVNEEWPGLYALWEYSLLRGLGFGLDLRSCAATGATQELVYVSPRSGRAVSRAAGAEYSDRLLALPGFLRDGDVSVQPSQAELEQALRLTGYFLSHRLMPALGREALPDARERLLRALFDRPDSQTKG
ncbi:MAG: DNA repair protein RecO [Paracoccaceae bacterium]